MVASKHITATILHLCVSVLVAVHMSSTTPNVEPDLVCDEKVTIKACQGDAAAQYSLSLCIRLGQLISDAKTILQGKVKEHPCGIPLSLEEIEDKEGFKLMELSANNGYVHSQYEVALAYDEKEKYDLAVEWYRKAADQGHGGSQYNLAVSYKIGAGTERDEDLAEVWLERALGNGEAEAAMMLARIYGQEKGDMLKASYFFEQAAQLGDVRAMFNLGVLYERGAKGLEVHIEKSLNWYEMAASKGHEGALHNLQQLKKTQQQKLLNFSSYNVTMLLPVILNASIKDALTGVASEKLHYAIAQLRNLAENGDSEAQFYLASCFENGIGGTTISSNSKYPDMGAALKLYQQSARQNHINSMLRLAVFYLEAEGVKERNRTKAMEYLMAAANQNEPRAMYRIALLLLEDNHPSISSVHWMSKAHDLHYLPASFSLGVLLSKDASTSNNATLMDQAVETLQMAATRGHNVAKSILASSLGVESFDTCSRDNLNCQQDVGQFLRTSVVASETDNSQIATWVRSNGGVIRGISSSPSMLGGGRGLRATRLLHAGERILSVPSSLWLTKANLAQHSPQLERFLKKHPLQNFFADERGSSMWELVLILEYERHSSTSHWKPYINALGAPTSPVLWDDELLNAFLSESIIREVQDLKKHIADFESKVMKTYFKIAPDLFNPETNTLESITWCTMQVLSRSFDLGKWGFSDKPALIPYMDFANHKRKAQYRTSWDPTSFDLNVEKASLADEELYISYGDEKATTSFIVNYGFLPSDNFGDFVTLMSQSSRSEEHNILFPVAADGFVSNMFLQECAGATGNTNDVIIFLLETLEKVMEERAEESQLVLLQHSQSYETDLIKELHRRVHTLLRNMADHLELRLQSQDFDEYMPKLQTNVAWVKESFGTEELSSKNKVEGMLAARSLGKRFDNNMLKDLSMLHLQVQCFS
eukprot:m.94299 g.94299  ORF g.94299 m.94299 type:complete len:938 (+) comp13439_c0_seq4:280-3093(+)